LPLTSPVDFIFSFLFNNKQITQRNATYPVNIGMTSVFETAGVDYHRLLFSKTEVMPMFTENNALGRSVLLKIQINIQIISFNF
jgi:hypothetical protein